MIGLIGCSGGNNENAEASDTSSYDKAEENKNSRADDAISENKSTGDLATSNGDSAVVNQSLSTDQMIIYHANLRIEVKDSQKTKDALEQLIIDKNGYISNSSSQQISEGQVEGFLVIRIPQEHFHQFLDEVEELSIKVHHQSIDGMDVTEEFVDLTSRLKSKEVVEQRLLQFMQEAQKTEDLLKISADLGKIQEEIEQIKGRVKYLQNQVSLSTIEIAFSENKIIVPSIDKNELNTWENTKKQFITSIQFILSFCSGLFIFLIGNSPVLISFAVLVGLIFLVYRKNKKKSSLPTNSHDENI